MIIQKKKTKKSYLLVKENTLEKIRYLWFHKYSWKNRYIHNLNKNKTLNKEQKAIRTITELKFKGIFICDVNVTIPVPKIYL